MSERLQKLISQAGIASRRDAEELIQQGRVTVNGVRAKLGDKADPEADDVRVDGERLKFSVKRIYVMVNKPRGVVTTTRAQAQDKRKTINDLVPSDEYLYPVGRLDADSDGLVLLTNDGELAERLTHPRYEHPKEYEVVLYGRVPPETLDIWRRGVVLAEDGPEPTRPVQIEDHGYKDGLHYVRVTMYEGRKRQIRRVASVLGFPVRKLTRVAFDTLRLGDLGVGEWRNLTDKEIETLKHSAAEVSPARRRTTKPPQPRRERGDRPEQPRRYRDERGSPERAAADRPPHQRRENDQRDERFYRDERGSPERAGSDRPPHQRRDNDQRDERSYRDERGSSDRRPRQRRENEPSEDRRSQSPRPATRYTPRRPGQQIGRSEKQTGRSDKDKRPAVPAPPRRPGTSIPRPEDDPLASLQRPGTRMPRPGDERRPRPQRPSSGAGAPRHGGGHSGGGMRRPSGRRSGGGGQRHGGR